MAEVKNLYPFEKNSTSVQVQGDLHRRGNQLKLSYEFFDSKQVLWLPETGSFLTSACSREDNLWMTTCFEMFLRPAGLEKYYEFNFSLKPAWNAYVFEKYRSPQPPQETNDFKLVNFEFNGSRLDIELESLIEIKTAFVSLTAVIKEKNESKHYLALAHAGEKADFHLASSFILER